MSAAYLLILLTMTEAGGINSSFVSTDNLLMCESKSTMLKTIISASGTKVIKSSCFKSDLKFSKFGHKKEGVQATFGYRIALTDEAFDIASLDEGVDCLLDNEKELKESKANTYCTISTQQIIKNNETREND